MAKFNVAGEKHFSITGQLLEIQRQIRQKGGSPLDPDLLELALQDIIEGKLNYSKETKILDCIEIISHNDSVTIPECNGNSLITTGQDGFCVSESFRKIQEYAEIIKTEETKIGVFSLKEKATFKQIFSSHDLVLDKLCLTSNQIKIFCKKIFSMVAP
jgi:hypothetical protein